MWPWQRAPQAIALAIDSALECRMYHCPMPDPKVLNAAGWRAGWSG